VKNELGEPDESGRRRPVPIEGSEFTIECDHVIAAIGQRHDTAALHGDLDLGPDRRGAIPAHADTGATKDRRIFAAGDITGTGWTVIDAIAQGRKAALGIDRLLAGESNARPLTLHTADEVTESMRYHPDGVEAQPDGRPQPAVRDGAERRDDFDEFDFGLNEEQVLAEANRCLSCGQCARCNNCIDNFGCPAIYKADGRIHIDPVLCTACGVCAQLCPNDAIVPVAANGEAVN
jgi:ferredoxin